MGRAVFDRDLVALDHKGVCDRGSTRRAWYRKDLEERRAIKDAPVIEALNEIIGKHRRWDFWLRFHRRRMLGREWNHKRVWRIYKAMKLNLKRRKKKRLPLRKPATLDVPAKVNETWSFDFMSDSLYSGLRFRVLNIIDHGVRETHVKPAYIQPVPTDRRGTSRRRNSNSG